MKKSIIIMAVAALLAACGGGEGKTDNPAVPEAPANLKLHEATTASLVFQWSPVENAVGYKWRLLEGGTEVNGGKVTARNVSVDGLKADTAYTFGVRSVGSDGSESSETKLEASTLKDESGNGNGENDGENGNGNENLTARYAEFMIPAAEEDGAARAFPGAEGGGMWATGGRGGKVYHVTNLKDSGEGSLRYGIENGERPLTIVFDVAGVIPLTKQLMIKKGDLTIAGQTAPGDGICLKNYTFRVHANNVIVRFIRCRMGDELKTEDDAMQIMDKYGDSFENIIIDHCSVSWSTDECASFYGMKNFTFQWNIVSESLRKSIHGKGDHGYGGIWGGTNATYHHNLLAHHDSRNPRLDHDYVSHQKGPVSVFNNIVYNWSGNTCYGGESSSKTEAFNGYTYRMYNFFNNYYKPGPATPSNHIWFLEPTTSCSNCGGTILPGHFYMDGNVMYGKDYSDNWSTSAVHANQGTIDKIKESEPYHTEEYQSVHSGEGCLEPVLQYAGASFARDAIDTRIAEETRKGTYTYNGSNGSTKGLIDTQNDVGGWPEYGASEEVRDSDMDGMPDWFEVEFGLNKSSAADAQAISLDPSRRYTNLEMYLHYVVRNIVAAQNENSNYSKL